MTTTEQWPPFLRDVFDHEYGNHFTWQGDVYLIRLLQGVYTHTETMPYRGYPGERRSHERAQTAALALLSANEQFEYETNSAGFEHFDY